MAYRRRTWIWSDEDDPLAGLINLCDLWIVLAVCFLLSALSGVSVRQEAGAGTATSGLKRLPRYRVSTDSLTGRGKRLGIAYRLQGGEVVYVPDSQGD